VSIINTTGPEPIFLKVCPAILATANIKTKRQQAIALIGKTIWQPILEGLNAYEVFRTLRGSDPARCPKCKQGIMVRYSMEAAPG